ncbi:MAG: xanthine dehydrogenase family protein molybdopterin-binding subunit [Proteobacteria bacterium]|nr:xanthine dehydrogenase family protein molybdopterin-binding subunit [Pseudomonadota bacterium]
MSKSISNRAASLTRRDVVAGGAGLTFAFAFGGPMTGRPDAALAATDTAAKVIGGWVTIGTDNSITIAAPIAEMGQGANTSLPMIVAEELDADWSKVKPFVPPAVPGLYGNPQFRGIVYVVASRTTDGYWDKARVHGAQARRVLMQAAADKWGVALSELATEPSVVVHKPSNRRMSYGEIAQFATVPAEMPKVELAELKQPSEYRIIGNKAVKRFDIPAKTNGSAKYGIDVQVDGMLYATLLRSPLEGGEPEHVDAAALLKIPGVTQTIALTDAVAVVGTSVEAVFKARDALKVKWKGGATAGYDSEKSLGDYVKRARNLGEKGLSYRNAGDTGQAFAKAAKVVTADLTTDYVYHAQMEPMNVTAQVNAAGDGADIWIGTQGQTPVAGAAAGFLKTKPQNIKVHQQFLGGGFGRRAATDLPVYGLAIAKRVGKPVKLLWTREQDVQAAWMRPQTAHHLEAALDDQGNLMGWRHRIVGEAVTGYVQAARLEAAKGLDPLTLEGAEHLYAVDNLSVEYLREIHGTPLAAWRAIGSGPNKFAIESFIDEIARAQNMDPVAFRLKLLAKHPRGQKIVETVAKMANWGAKPAPDRALGFAYADIWRTPVAGAAEVSLDRNTGVIRVHRFWNAVNPGIVVNPDIVVQQSESNVVWGISQALKERVTIKDGAVQQSNFHDYQVLRMSEVPEIFTEIVNTNHHPTGIGEIVLPVVAPAVANAVYALTGKRLRHMPFTPERVKEALKA